MILFVAKRLKWHAITVVKDDIIDATGALQMCAGQIAGCEAAVHLVHEHFQEPNTGAVLLVSASNAFNALDCPSQCETSLSSNFNNLN